MKISAREEQCLAQLRLGASNKEIANALGLTEGTVKQYLFNLGIKLGLPKRFQMAVWAENRARDAAA